MVIYIFLLTDSAAGSAHIQVFGRMLESACYLDVLINRCELGPSVT